MTEISPITGLNHLRNMTKLAQLAADLFAQANPAEGSRMQGEVDAAQLYMTRWGVDITANAQGKQQARAPASDVTGAEALVGEVERRVQAALDRLDAVVNAPEVQGKMRQASEQVRTGVNSAEAGVQSAVQGLVTVAKAAGPLWEALAALGRGPAK